ncbi:lysM and putative peptidoglycan-binding domain-containing protein 1 [Hippoglossus hippoglossus]|uniref:lysM and putative peptidoglycan-binding domain-containing protein 1 n=1 Tax=Hippoglossus hippoglossus TaxID=8267 RepID=UPI00148CE20B|nr:lysM and putative peptidoglycan-binding domain-containing protein 1 [Hippoglossus hippoglossus]
MSGARTPPAADGSGLLRGSRSRSYGSLVRSPRSPVPQRRIQHELQPGETLPGLALRYGVSMEQIKRANRLYTNDSIFLKKTLSIPVLSDRDVPSNGLDLAAEDDAGCAQNGQSGSASEKKPCDGRERAADMTPVGFMKRLDELIHRSKEAAVKGHQDAEKRVAALEAACTSGTSDWRRLTQSQSVSASYAAQQQEVAYRAMPLTVTRLTKKLRDREDEIFEL